MEVVIFFLFVVAIIMVLVGHANRKQGFYQDFDVVSKNPVKLIGSGSSDYEIVGESFYQHNIKKALNLSGGKSSKSFQVRLIYDDYNKYDSNAIAVYIGKYQVGHLSKREAINYRNRMKVLGFSGREAVCDATVWGGGDKDYYGIFLYYDPRKTKQYYSKKKSA